MSDVYTHGHHESVLRSHTWRTAENSAGYLLNSLRPGLDLLDVGCGPATITIDLARRVAPGRTVGLDRASEVIDQAKALSTWTYADQDACAWRGALWADRCELSAFGQQAVDYGLSTRDELLRIAEAWRKWARQPAAFFAVLHDEILARS